MISFETIKAELVLDKPYIRSHWLLMRDGSVRKLSLLERIACWFDIHNALTLEQKYRPELPPL